MNKNWPCCGTPVIHLKEKMLVSIKRTSRLLSGISLEMIAPALVPDDLPVEFWASNFWKHPPTTKRGHGDYGLDSQASTKFLFAFPKISRMRFSSDRRLLSERQGGHPGYAKDPGKILLIAKQDHQSLAVAPTLTLLPVSYNPTTPEWSSLLQGFWSRICKYETRSH